MKFLIIATITTAAFASAIKPPVADPWNYCPDLSYWNGQACQCNWNYKFNDAHTQCVPLPYCDSYETPTQGQDGCQCNWSTQNMYDGIHCIDSCVSPKRWSIAKNKCV